MKQVLQSYKTGELKVAEVPAPGVMDGSVLVRTTVSLVSAGTEKMVMDLAKKSLAGKAADRPDLVKKVADKLAKDGVLATAKAVLGKLDQPIPLGYSAAGVVLECGAGVTKLTPGQRVAAAGAKVANHAEFNLVPVNLSVPIPDGVSDDAAAFVTLGAIALQGVRTANLTLGERVGVIGLGLIGQLTVQLLAANGCRVLGVDLDPAKCSLARALGADEAVVRNGDLDAAVAKLTDGRGLDAVIVCAATDSNDPVELAGELARDRARVVVVGAVPMNVPRRPYYDKELSLLLSRSYGPGRYDPSYEEQGHDYPFGYVRWTEGRNLQAFLELCAAGKVRVDKLITHRFDIAQAEGAYALISGARQEPFLGVLLTYPDRGAPERTVPSPALRTARPTAGRPRLSLVGAGSFATAVLAPELARREDVALSTVVSARGISARHAAERFGFARCSTDDAAALTEDGCDAVIIATRHELHAAQAAAALEAGKGVFVEKPLAIDRAGLSRVVAAVKGARGLLMVDFNRRFAPTVVAARDFFRERGQPLVLQYRVNAGPIPPGSWIHDPASGGGRIIGEVCHFVDLAAFLVGAEVVRLTAQSVAEARAPLRNDDQVALTLQHADGSLSSLLYTSGGDPALPKERIELHAGGASGLIDDFKVFEGTRGGRTVRSRSLTKDKGHRGALEAFVAAVRAGGPSPTPLRGLVSVTLATFFAQEALGTLAPVELAPAVDALLGGAG